MNNSTEDTIRDHSGGQLMAGEANHIVVDGVSKVYDSGKGPAVTAISQASFKIKRGEFVSILGPSGCGKSTLLMIVSGLDTASTGAVHIDGQPVSRPRSTTGMMFQDSTLLPWKSVLDNVLFPIDVQRKSREKYLPAAHDLLQLTGLQDFADRRPSELSGGMRQRVSICRSLIYDPDVLLMDEPFSALDAITRDELGEALLNIWQVKPKTGLFVTHSIREAAYLSDRILVMSSRPGRIVEDISVSFTRPRVPALQAQSEFIKLCAFLKKSIHARYD